MTHSYSFKYEELTIDLPEIVRVLGYEGQELPEPFPTYLALVADDCKNLTDISGSYCITEQCVVDPDNKKIVANDLDFNVGKTICNELNGSSNLAFFICTAGETVSKKSEILLKGEDPVLGYVYDVFGSVIAEAAANKIQDMIKAEAQKSGSNISNRYSPGYCQWHVSDQPKLFSLFNGSTSNVNLTSSFLMNPVKSVSGVIGIGKKVKYRDYQCALCGLQTCIYRKMRT